MLEILERASIKNDEITCYDALEKQFRKEVEKKLGYKGTKEKEFIDAGFVPFTNESVQKYKKTLIDSLLKPNKIIGKTLVCGAIISATIAYLTFDEHVGFLISFFASIATIAMITFGMCCFLEQPLYRWVQIPIDKYPKKIPEFALDTALRVKTAFPDCSIFIEEIDAIKIIDPFLVVYEGNNFYYLEVWNELSYKQERMA